MKKKLKDLAKNKQIKQKVITFLADFEMNAFINNRR